MRILLVEDDEKLCEAIIFALEREGHIVDACHEGDDGLRWILQQAHDLILLDRMLPVMDGISILKRIRAEGIAIPVVLVTALGSVGERVGGLDAGADDYLVKPFDFEELLARIHSVLRRPVRWEGDKPLKYGDISFEIKQKMLYCNKITCSLSAREGNLLEFFLRNPGMTIPRASLLSKVWGPDASVEDGNLDNYIYLLRRRLKGVKSVLQLKTVRGIGYRLEVPHD